MNVKGPKLDNKTIQKYALKGHYGEKARLAAVKAQSAERRLKKDHVAYQNGLHVRDVL